MTKSFLKKVLRGQPSGFPQKTISYWMYLAGLLLCVVLYSPKATKEGPTLGSTRTRDTRSIGKAVSLLSIDSKDLSEQNIHSVAFYGEAKKTFEGLEGINPSADFYRCNEVLRHASQIPSITPLRIQTFRISSAYGMRKHPISGRYKNHKGYDLAAPKGTPVHATASGQVKVVDVKDGYGRVIVLGHSDGFETLYAHLEASFVEVGDRIEQGQVIASVGNSGNVTGFHLHYELIRHGKPIDPQKSFGRKRSILRKWLLGRIENGSEIP
ncbi:M23 family metallopeptidase [Maribacter flavus]|uniref:M23 family metallopeptidase n=1 Tax=Maribacter flavus TaxID=1658664 RepID=A0A5B2TMM4_9FLAO|nr:M23 family metallopeptidase [Maribacter flavus]KAA2215781.1 M23 family metallopeptidase [Maribacter flavus]